MLKFIKFKLNFLRIEIARPEMLNTDVLQKNYCFEILA